MLYAKPWQRYALSIAMVVLGLTLAVLGQTRGFVLVAIGGFMIFEVIRYRLAPRRKGQQ